jgi:outer membrane lipase/esterase
MVPAPPLSQSLRSPSYSLPAVVLGRDWATATIGMQVSFTPAWSGIGLFMAQPGQNHATVFGGLIGLICALAQTPAPIVCKN